MNRAVRDDRQGGRARVSRGSNRVALAPTLALLALLALVTGCASRPGEPLARRGDEIVVCGQLYHIGAPVVLWTDPGGYDAYRVERRFVPFEDANWPATTAAGIKEPNRYNLRFERTAAAAYSPEELERVRGGGWDLELLRSKVDQFVIHYDVCGTSRTCFRVLQDARGLSVHFLLDLDGTIYQTLDLKERAWHATIANDRSIGIEIAHLGAAPAPAGWTAPLSEDLDLSRLPAPLKEWYGRDADGRTVVTIPPRLGDGGVRTKNFTARPATGTPVLGGINGAEYVQFDLTPEQYRSLARLMAGVHRVLPQVRLEAPREASTDTGGPGAVLTRTLTPEEFASFKGVLGHYHVQANKVDPGPAFRWDDVLREARRSAGER
jgi:hypothetical protein